MPDDGVVEAGGRDLIAVERGVPVLALERGEPFLAVEDGNVDAVAAAWGVADVGAVFEEAGGVDRFPVRGAPDGDAVGEPTPQSGGSR